MASTSVISSGQIIEGTIQAGEDLVVDGRVDGSVESSHNVIVTADGILEASVRAREVTVEGVVIGDVTATDDVIVTASGQVQGEIRAKRLTLEAGGRICGMVVTGVEPVTTKPRPRQASARARSKTATWSPADLPTPVESGEAEEVEPPKVAAPPRAKTGRKATARSRQGRARSGRKRSSANEVVEVDEIVESSSD